MLRHGRKTLAGQAVDINVPVSLNLNDTISFIAIERVGMIQLVAQHGHARFRRIAADTLPALESSLQFCNRRSDADDEVAGTDLLG